MLNKLSKLINKLKFKNTILKDDKYLNREINSDSSKSESTNNNLDIDSFNNNQNLNNIIFDDIAVKCNKSKFINTDLNDNSKLPEVLPGNIKINIKKAKQKEVSRKVCSKDPYENETDKIHDKYHDVPDKNKNNFNIIVSSAVCSTPIFNLRTHKDLDFYYNFLIHNFSPSKINNLIMCKDIHQWMTTSSLSSDDLNDDLVPIYFIKKSNGFTDVFEYLKIFIYTDKDGIKIAFIQKGADYFLVKNDIDKLIEKNLIKDLLFDKHYINYNLSSHCGVSDFLTRFLSLVLISDTFIGDEIKLDIEYYNENHKTFDYFFNTLNCDIGVFNTTI
jgi:hypothetical protein